MKRTVETADMDHQPLDTESTNWRYEWRIWGPELHEQRSRLHEYGSSGGVVVSEELYLVGPNRRVNAKIRDEVVETKQLVDVRRGFEQWRPDLSEALPARPSTVARLLADLGLAPFTPGRPAQSILGRLGKDGPEERLQRSRLISLVVAASGLAVPVRKRRHHFTLATRARAEAVEVTVHDRVRWGVAIESTDVEELDRLRRLLGLDGTNTPVHIEAADLALRSDQ
jgi:hypothetical protein